MRKLYWLTLIIFLASFLNYSTQVSKETYNFTIPHVVSGIEVTDWDRTLSAPQIFKKIEQFAEENDLSLYKVNFGVSNNGNTDKYITAFNDKDSLDHLITSDETRLSTESPLGGYYLTENLPNNLTNLFTELGLDFNVTPDFRSIIIFQFFSDSFGWILTWLFLVLLLIDSFSIVSLSKKIGIFLLNGKKVTSIYLKQCIGDLFFSFLLLGGITFYYPEGFWTNIWAILLLLLFLQINHLIALWLVTKKSTISNSIKGYKIYKPLINVIFLTKCLSIIGGTLLISQGYHNMTQLKHIEQNLKVWGEIGHYYTLEFSPYTSLITSPAPNDDLYLSSEEKVRAVVSDILSLGEASGGILVETHHLNSYHIDNIKVPSHHYMVVNPQFLKEVSILDRKGNRVVDLNPDTFYLLIPSSLKAYQKEIEKVMRDVIMSHRNIQTDYSESYEGNIVILETLDNQSAFNFNKLELDNSKVHNPVILVGSTALYGEKSDYLVGEVSQGHYLFKDTTEILDYIAKNNLNSEFSGLLSIRETALKELQYVRYQIRLSAIGLISSLAILVMMNIFIILVYLEERRKRVFLMYLHGKKYLERHKNQLGTMLGIPMLSLLVSILIEIDNAIICIYLILIDIVLSNILLFTLEKRNRIGLLKKGE